MLLWLGHLALTTDWWERTVFLQVGHHHFFVFPLKPHVACSRLLQYVLFLLSLPRHHLFTKFVHIFSPPIHS